jgi:hypothetical protein
VYLRCDEGHFRLTYRNVRTTKKPKVKKVRATRLKRLFKYMGIEAGTLNGIRTTVADK